MKNIVDIAKKRLVVLDGAMGTQLQKMGMPAGVSPENWCLENPSKLADIHKNYLAAGADVIYTATFGANRIKLGKTRGKSVKRINKDLALIAKEVAGEKALVAGDIGPTGKLVEPFGSLEFEEAVAIFKEQVEGLLSAGVNLFVIETMIDIQEARAALLAVKELTDKFTIVSMTFEKNGFTLGGTNPLAALITLQSLGADCFGCNCSAGPGGMLKIIKEIKPYATVPLLAKPNAGLPRLREGKTVFDMGAEEFSNFLPAFAAAGVNFIGGCCGTEPSHIKALKKKSKNKKPRPVSRAGIAALSSARASYFFDENKPLALIGECINPTGKKELSRQLQKNDTSLIRELAKKQERAGADILDVNVAAVGIDERKLIKKVVNLLSRDSSLPLAVDSSNPDVIEEFLRLYPARALINSISAGGKKSKKLLSLASKYGAMFIGLPVTGKSMPKSLEGRKKNIETIRQKAGQFGFNKDDFIIDTLILAAASNPEGPRQALDTISWAKNNGYRTVIGLSNVSFGLPRRSLINSSFLNLAQSRGLDCVIASPLSEKVMGAKKAADFLLKKASAFYDLVESCPGSSVSFFQGKSKLKDLSKEEKEVYRLILEGQKEKIKNALNQALKEGKSPYALIEKSVIPALEQAGEFFGQKIYFLPQLISSAEAARAAFSLLQPKMKKKSKAKTKTVIVLATVKGDIHDIGKNIVALMLANHGFEIVDLGKDVSAAKIIKAVKNHKAPLVGLSALMTTTMVNMEEVVDLAKKEKLNCDFIVGGAVVTKSYARQLGAEYASDGLEAVRVAKKLEK